MKTAMIGVTAMALAATLGPRGAVAQCWGDCNGDNEVTIEEIIARPAYVDAEVSETDPCVGAFVFVSVWPRPSTLWFRRRWCATLRLWRDRPFTWRPA